MILVLAACYARKSICLLILQLTCLGKDQGRDSGCKGRVSTIGGIILAPQRLQISKYIMSHVISTLPETNIARENGWLEY